MQRWEEYKKNLLTASQWWWKIGSKTF